MAYQSIFKRYELKYLLSAEQKDAVLRAIAPFMARDRYGRTVIRNLYYDTDTYRLIRRSIEKPVYKEKLRVRSYARAEGGDAVFVELKKKYDGVVYKRRIALPYGEAMAWLAGEAHCGGETQIADEIDYFLAYYETLRPRVFLSYEREAYFETSGGDFRVTFDENILAREERLSLAEAPFGALLLPSGQTLMEIKCAGGIPLPLVHAMREAGICKSSFSKYGTAYTEMILPRLRQSQNLLQKETVYHA
ncbi:MAG: polyphosphate polymerase domain-containing protein [Clostridia bacterium]|nr:polyphosphate polymerase domain-containing protein [Clostridia bacterium]